MKKQTVIKLKNANLMLAKFLEFVLALFACILVFVAIVEKDNLANVFGFELNIIKSGSMSPNLNKLDFVVTHKENPNNIKVGDVIVFYDDSGKYKILHRVNQIVFENGQKLFVTKGDNNKFADAGKRKTEDVYAKLGFRVPFAGMILTFFTSTHGVAILLLNAFNFYFLMYAWKSEEKKKFYTEKEFKKIKRKKLKPTGFKLLGF